MLVEILIAAILILLLVSLFTLFLTGRRLYTLLINFLPPGVFLPVLTEEEKKKDTAVVTSWKYKFMMLKAYFDNGYSLTSYPKWVLATVGIGSAIQGYALLWLFAGGIAYGILCFILGCIFLKYGFYEAQQEVSNQFNLFVKEVRERKTI